MRHLLKQSVACITTLLLMLAFVACDQPLDTDDEPNRKSHAPVETWVDTDSGLTLFSTSLELAAKSSTTQSNMFSANVLGKGTGVAAGSASTPLPTSISVLSTDSNKPFSKTANLVSGKVAVDGWPLDVRLKLTPSPLVCIRYQ